MVIHIEFDIKITDQDGVVLHSVEKQLDKTVASGTKQESDTVLGIDFTDFLAEYLSSSGFFLREKLMKGRSSRKPKRQEHSKVIRESRISDEPEDDHMLDRLKGSELEYKIRIGDNKVLTGKLPLKIDADENAEHEQYVVSASLVTEESDGNKEDTVPPESPNPDKDAIISELTDTNKDMINSKSTGTDKDTISSNSADTYRDTISFESTGTDRDMISYESTDIYNDMIYSESIGTDREMIHSELTGDYQETNSLRESDSDSEPAIYSFLNYSMMRAIEKYEDNIYNVWYEDSTDMEPAIDE